MSVQEWKWFAVLYSYLSYICVCTPNVSMTKRKREKEAMPPREIWKCIQKLVGRGQKRKKNTREAMKPVGCGVSTAHEKDRESRFARGSGT